MTSESCTFIDRLKRAYATLTPDSPDTLREFYSEDAVFIDPAHTIHGREALLQHFARVSKNVTECRFEFDAARELITEDCALLSWTMYYRHPRLRRGQLIELEGASLLRLRPQIVFHQDWFDLGSMVYEHVPILGRAVRLIKQGL